ncbi:hypothetical protein L873DRAFT_1660946, partial [Choiromyces venosus 120613-1]
IASLVLWKTISTGTSLISSTITLLDCLSTVTGNAYTLAKLQLPAVVVVPSLFPLISTSTGCSFARYALRRSYFGGKASREMNGKGKRMLDLSTDWGSFSLVSHGPIGFLATGVMSRLRNTPSIS